MPIVFIHGVAVRREGDPGWAQVHRVTRGVDWEELRAALREFVAPAVRPDDPAAVRLSEIYWGDLGASYGLGGRSLSAWSPPQTPRPAPERLSPDEIGEQLENELRRRTSTRDWPTLLETVWDVAHDENLRAISLTLPPERQWAFLSAAVEARLPSVTLRERLEEPRLPARLVEGRRRGLRRTFSTVRRPLEDFVPLFLGDVLAYLGGRGTPGQPGPVMRRVIDGLLEARAGAAAGEPLVVLTHSMGGQLLYDALTAFLPAEPRAAGLRVDFWCACGPQVGLFRELGQFVERGPLPTRALIDSPHAGYFWNVWSYSDLLSFRAEGVIAGAHDVAFPFPASVRSDHLSYLHSPDFFRALGAKIRVRLGSRPSTPSE